MDRRKYLVAVGGMASFAGCMGVAEGSQENSGNTSSNETATDNGMVDEDSLYVISEPDDLGELPFEPNIVAEFEGEGSSVTEEFELEERVTMLVYESAASIEGFEADMEQVDGDEEYIWAILEVVFSGDDREIVSGGSLVETQGGSYLLDINTEGEWRLAVAQPSVPDGEVRSTPVSVEGEDSAIVGPLEANNGLTVYGNHADESVDNSFDVLVYQEDTSGFMSMDYAFTEDPGFEGEARVDVDGVVWAAVSTRGEWTLEFEN